MGQRLGGGEANAPQRARDPCRPHSSHRYLKNMKWSPLYQNTSSFSSMPHPPCGNRTNGQAITKKCESVFIKREGYVGCDSMLCASCPGYSGEPLGQSLDDARAIGEIARLTIGTQKSRVCGGRVRRRRGKRRLTQRTGVDSHCTWGHPLHSACFSRLPYPSNWVWVGVWEEWRI